MSDSLNPNAKRKTSIKDKLIRMQMVISTIVVATVVGITLVSDGTDLVKGVQSDFASLSRVLANGLRSPIAFMDQKEADRVLQAVSGLPAVKSAVVLTSDRKVFAQAGDPPLFDWSRVEAKDSSLFLGWGYYYYGGRILDDSGELVGSVILQANPSMILSKILRILFTTLFALVASLGVSYLLAQYSHRAISEPVVQLAETAKEISSSGNYSLRMVFEDEAALPLEIEALAQEFNTMLEQVQSRDIEIQKANLLLEAKVRKRTEELQQAQAAALKNAHAAGMAEISSSVLHNIGNMMNSLNVSISEMLGIARKSSVTGILKVSQLIESQRDRLAEFFASDDRGKALPDYLAKTGAVLAEEQASMLKELEFAAKKTGMIKDVIRTQQDYARGGVYREEVDIVQSIEDILAMQQASLDRSGVQIERKLLPIGQVKIERLKFANIMVNLIKNGKEAMEGNPPGEKVLTIETGLEGDRKFFVRVKDQGEGIPQENLEKIFQHGFTTKREGHGFGLHFCANAMTEMGGRLVVSSEGKGKGACFTLLFPHVPDKLAGTSERSDGRTV